MENPWNKSVSGSEEADLQRTWLELYAEAKAKRYEPPPYEFPKDAESSVYRYVFHAFCFACVLLLLLLLFFVSARLFPYWIVLLIFRSFPQPRHQRSGQGH
jgi:hypothetical protein